MATNFGVGRVLAGLLVVASAAGIATPAQATDGLAWKWSEGASRTYHIAGQIRLPRFIFFNALNNTTARISEARIELVTTCTPTDAYKKGWDLDCIIDDISIQAVPLPADKGRMDEITAEWDQRLTGAHLDVQFWSDGRIRAVNFEGMERRNRRDGENIERVRQLMARMMSPLDMRLPKNGDDKGAGAWNQKDALILGFPSLTGSAGAVELVHQIQGTKDSKVKIATAGDGTLGYSESATETAGQETIDYYKMEGIAEGTFDTAAGEIIERQVAVTGTPTASASIADGTPGLTYVQAYRVTLVREGQPRPSLPDSKEIAAAFGPPE